MNDGVRFWVVERVGWSRTEDKLVVEVEPDPNEAWDPFSLIQDWLRKAVCNCGIF